MFVGLFPLDGHKCIVVIYAKYKYQLLSDITTISKDQRKIVPFKLDFVDGLQCLGFTSSCSRHKSILGDKLFDALKFVTCFTSKPSLFRIIYKRFLFESNPVLEERY